jgi:N-acetylglutamate synthase-like GNAT family acetyltransferase
MLLESSYPVLMAAAYDEALLAPALRLMTKASVPLLASGTYYVAETRDGAIIGCGGWTRERPGTGTVEPGLGHVRHFGVYPAYTHRGVGRTIYRLCEAGARSAGVTVFECYASLNAEKFYSALGFESIHRMDLELQPGVTLPAMLMRRQI